MHEVKHRPPIGVAAALGHFTSAHLLVVINRDACQAFEPACG